MERGHDIFTRLSRGSAGRVVRVVTGAALIAIGLGAFGETPGYLVASLGMLPLAAHAVQVARSGDRLSVAGSRRMR